MTRIRTPTSAEMANKKLDEACEEIAAIAGMPGSADPLVAQTHSALAKLADAVSWTLSALNEQAKRSEP